jgi:hypothetical protein
MRSHSPARSPTRAPRPKEYIATGKTYHIQRRKVFNGDAYKMRSGLTREALTRSKSGAIVSLARHLRGVRERGARLATKGYALFSRGHPGAVPARLSAPRRRRRKST